VRFGLRESREYTNTIRFVYRKFMDIIHNVIRYAKIFMEVSEPRELSRRGDFCGDLSESFRAPCFFATAIERSEFSDFSHTYIYISYSIYIYRKKKMSFFPIDEFRLNTNPFFVRKMKTFQVFQEFERIIDFNLLINKMKTSGTWEYWQIYSP